MFPGLRSGALSKGQRIRLEAMIVTSKVRRFYVELRKIGEDVRSVKERVEGRIGLLNDVLNRYESMLKQNVPLRDELVSRMNAIRDAISSLDRLKEEAEGVEEYVSDALREVEVIAKMYVLDSVSGLRASDEEVLRRVERIYEETDSNVRSKLKRIEKNLATISLPEETTIPYDTRNI